MLALPTRNAIVLAVTRQQPAVAAADDWETVELEDIEDQVLFAGRADAVLFQSDVLQSTGTEVNLVTSKRLLIPQLCELKVDDRIEIDQDGSERTYKVTGLFLDSSGFHNGGIYSLTVQEV